MAMVILFLVFIIMLLYAEKLDKKENIKEAPKQAYQSNMYYPTKCERCKKIDNFVTKPNMRFCNSCHCDYMMLD